MRPIEQQMAFEALCDAMRRSGGQLSLQDLRGLALAKLRVVALDWTTARRKQVADIVASSVSANFQLRKTSPMPQDPRSAKARRAAEILRYFDLSPEPKPSVRKVAEEFGISVATTHAILAKAEIRTDANKPNTLSIAAQALVALIDDQLPSRGCRLVDFKHVQWALNREERELICVFDELAAARQPLTVLDTGLSTGRDYKSTWLVVQRGKNKTPKDLLAWGQRQARAMDTDARARVDQRIVLRMEHEPALPSNRVLRDVGAVLLISQGSSSLRTWQAFLDASCVIDTKKSAIPSSAIIINDPGAILTAVNGASRRMVLDDRLGQMAHWLNDPIDASGAKTLFKLARDLRANTLEPPLKLIQHWAAVTRYRERIVAGLLPGRAVDDLDMLTSYVEITDLNELYELFLACPSNCVPPPFLVERHSDSPPLEWIDADEMENVDDIFDETDDLQNDEGYILPPDEEE
jgi:hypothetical protein